MPYYNFLLSMFSSSTVSHSTLTQNLKWLNIWCYSVFTLDIHTLLQAAHPNTFDMVKCFCDELATLDRKTLAKVPEEFRI